MNIKICFINFLMTVSISSMLCVNALAGDWSNEESNGQKMTVKRPFQDDDLIFSKKQKLTDPSEQGGFVLPLPFFPPTSFPAPNLDFSARKPGSSLPVPNLACFTPKKSLCPPTPGKNKITPTVATIGPLLADTFDNLELLGSGFEASVFKARYRENNKEVALKVIRKTAYNRKKLKIEFDYSKLLEKSGRIIQFKDTFEKGEFIFIVTNLFTKDLAKYLEDNDSIPEETLWSFITDIALGLHALEQNNLVHRDIKPENLFLDADGRAIIGDLGMLVQVSGDPDKDSQKDFDAGDSRYAAVELLQASQISHKIDIASFGFSLLEMMTRIDLPKGDNAWENLREEGGAKELLHVTYSDELKQLVRDMINPNPEARPAASKILEHPRVKEVRQIH